MKGRKYSIFINTLVVIAASSITAFPQMKDSQKTATVKFKVRIENISNADGFTASNGVRWPFVISPGAYSLHRGPGNPLFTVGSYSSEALRSQAEDGNPDLLVNLASHHAGVRLSEVFNTPVKEMKPGPVGPGGAYEFEVTATPGAHLFVTFMFGQSNDLFYGNEKAIALFDGAGKPVSSDITSQFGLWDAGTEVNEEPGIGPNQAPRQPRPHTGPREHERIGLANDSYTYPKTGDVLRITITPDVGMM